MRLSKSILAASLLLSINSSTQAALVDIRGELPVLNITWLQDSNYASSLPGCDFAISDVDCGWSHDSINSVLARIYFNNLGFTSMYHTGGFNQSDSDIFGNDIYNGESHIAQDDVELVKKLQIVSYWSGTEYAPNSDDSSYFPLAQIQNTVGNNHGVLYAKLARSSDVDVPVPRVTLLFGTGLIGLMSFMRRGNMR